MRVLYIDIYFLINFSVDFIALYFAALLAKVPTSRIRLILASLLGGLLASLIIVFVSDEVVKFLFSFVSLIVICNTATRKVNIRRRGKFVFSFFIFEALLGGAVSFLWSLLDRFLYPLLSEYDGGAENRNLLLLALVILLCIGVFKMIISFFSNSESEESAEIEIAFFGKKVRTEAFLDSGNLAKDPMDMRPVVLIKKSLAQDLLPKTITELRDPDLLSIEERKRIRLIPISRGGHTHVLTGVKVDYLRVINGNIKEEIPVTIAIDREGGDFGGYDVLMPSSAVADAFK